LLQCGGGAGSDGEGGSEDGVPAESAFVGAWRTGTVRDLSGDCFPAELKDELPAVTFGISSAETGKLRLDGYGAALAVNGRTATLVSPTSVTATNPKTGSVVTNRISAWSITLGTPAVVAYSSTVETKLTSGQVSTCALSVSAEATRTSDEASAPAAAAAPATP
jgi:hypothetical protein